MGGANFAMCYENVARLRRIGFKPFAELLLVRMGREAADFGDFRFDGNFFAENSNVLITVQNIAAKRVFGLITNEQNGI